MRSTGILFFPAFDWSLGITHPEREERLLYTQEQLFEEGIMDLPQIKRFAPGLAPLSAVLRTQAIFPRPQDHELDAHRIASGSAIVLGDAWAQKKIKNGFALVRPPGHHSGATVLGNRGFCTLNHEAILVNHLRTRYGIKRIAIIDTDVHHGNGTQDIFYHDPDILFVSMHQDGRTLFPGSGFVEEKGGPNAWDSTLNIPLLPGTGDEGFHYILEDWIMPKIQSFKPEIIINSAGQDNHFTDPLAGMNVTARGYGKITELIKPDLAVLEGGYSIEGALPYVNLAILLALAGEDYNNVTETEQPRRPEIPFSTLKNNVADLKKAYQDVKRRWSSHEQTFVIDGTWYYIPHSIYYDTDDFQEIRQDYVRKCSNCGGTIFMESQRMYRRNRYGVVRIPFNACKECAQAGYDLWEYFMGRMESLVLQDQPLNQTHFWHIDEGVTTY